MNNNYDMTTYIYTYVCVYKTYPQRFCEAIPSENL